MPGKGRFLVFTNGGFAAEVRVDGNRMGDHQRRSVRFRVGKADIATYYSSCIMIVNFEIEPDGVNFRFQTMNLVRLQLYEVNVQHDAKEWWNSFQTAIRVQFVLIPGSEPGQ